MSPSAPLSDPLLCPETLRETDTPRLLHPDAAGGEAAITVYSVFPGMELTYRDIHAQSCREESPGSGERLEIHHCLEGRAEYRQGSPLLLSGAGDLMAARASSLPRESRFPTGHYHGIAVMIDPAAAPECLSCILSDVEVRPAVPDGKAVPRRRRCLPPVIPRVKHVFS